MSVHSIHSPGRGQSRGTAQRWGLRGLALACLGAAAVAPAASAQTRYVLTDLGALPGRSASQAFSINNAGQAAGYSASGATVWSRAGVIRELGAPTTASGRAAYGINAAGLTVGYCDNFDRGPFRRAVLWSSAGVMRALALTPTTDSSTANAISAGGLVVGVHKHRRAPELAALWSGNTLRILGTLPRYSSSRALGINARGVVVGDCVGGASNGYGAFRWSASGGMAALPPLPGGYSSSARDINDAGQAVGYSSQPGSVVAALWNGNTIQSLGALPGHLNAYAEGINATGVVVGWSTREISVGNRAFVWANGVGMRDLNTIAARPAGWVLEQAEDINDAGQIVGNGLRNGQKRAFLLTPIPGPPNAAPRNLSLAPATSASAVGVGRIFSALYTDPNGASDLKSAWLRVGIGTAAAPNARTLSASYDALTNKLYLFNDAGTVLLGGFAPGTAGAVIQNSQGTLDCARTRVTRNASTINVQWALAPKAALVGVKPLWLGCTDKAGLADGPERFGAWNITAPSTPGA